MENEEWSFTRFREQYFCEFEHTEQDIKLEALAARYHRECEAYDRSVCTGPIIDGYIMPATTSEIGLINRNAHKVRQSVEAQARLDGIGRNELQQAIGRWDGPLNL